ncbi:MAG: TonB-dependent receptor [Parvularculaceae bacterium]|nr:TonB-dependent receptor [Parvularculaceae bacterium]
MKRHITLLLGSAASFALMTGAALAQDDSDEIVVTATKRAQSLQDVPFSVNAQTQDDLEKTGAQNLEDLSRNVAGLSIQNLGPGQSQVGLRGVSAGQIVRDQPGVKEQVGVYLDESVISLSLFTPDLDLFDLDRVETLRGPQGTLFGSGSIGGTIRYITNQPNLDEFEGMIEGNVNFVKDGGTGYHGKGMINAPLGDKAAFRLVGYWTEYGGFIDAFREGGGVDEDVNDGERYGFRAALRLEPFENFAVTPRFIYQDVDVNGFNRQEVYNLYANPFTTTRPPVTFGEREQHLLLREQFRDQTSIGDVTVDWDWGAVDFTSITSWTNRDILVSRDASALTHSVSIDLGYLPGALSIPSNLKDRTSLETFTQEARIASDYDDSRLDWLLGVFYTEIDRDYSQRLPTPGYDVFTDIRFGAGTSAAVANGFPLNSPYNADLPYDIKQFAVFAEGTAHLTPEMHFTAGARYYDFKEERAFVSGGLFSNGDNRTDTTESDGFSPRFILAYDLSDAVQINAQASKGFRLGGVNDPLNATLCTPADLAIFGGFQSYDDETLWNYEGGLKAKSGAFTTNIAGFYNDVKNLQVTLDAGSCSSRISFNVPDAHTLGVEWEIGYEPAEGLALSVAGTWLESEFDSTVVDGTGAVLAGLRDGNRLASVPQFQIAATASYTFPLGSNEGFLAATFQHVGTRFTQPSDQENNPRSFVSGLPFGGAPGTDATVLDLELPSYQIFNLTAGIDFEKWELLVYANNLFDENALLAFDRERGGRARLGFHVNEPRTIGVTARWRF